MRSTPSVTVERERPLGDDWPEVQRWKVTGEDQIDGVELRQRDDASRFVLVHRAITGGRWQATWFDEHGPGGDLRRATLEQAINEQAPPYDYTIAAIHLVDERVRANPAPFEPLETEHWPDGTVVTFLQSPFPYARKPAVPSSAHRGATRRRVELAALIGSQQRVTDTGLAKYARGGGELPIVYRTHAGELHIADGHHRLAAALRRGERSMYVRVVDVPKENPSMSIRKGARVNYWSSAKARKAGLKPYLGIVERVPRAADGDYDIRDQNGDLHIASAEEIEVIGRENPSPSAPTKAIRMFRLFHSRDWRGEGDFHEDLVIPPFIYRVGDAVKTDYESDKLNPSTGEDEGWIQYTHDHDGGVGVYMPRSQLTLSKEEAEESQVVVPAWIQRTDQMTWLGKCLGFQFRDEGGRVREARGTRPLPELYASPSGKALFVIQSKRSLIAIIWGGRLAVERRGIVH